MQMKRDNRWVPSVARGSRRSRGLALYLACGGPWRPPSPWRARPSWRRAGLPGECDVSPAATSSGRMSTCSTRACRPPMSRGRRPTSSRRWRPTSSAPSATRCSSSREHTTSPSTSDSTPMSPGLGANPDDVQINGGVNVNAKWADGTGAGQLLAVAGELRRDAVVGRAVPDHQRRHAHRGLPGCSPSTPAREGRACSSSTGVRRGTWATPAAVFWRTRS